MFFFFFYYFLIHLFSFAKLKPKKTGFACGEITSISPILTRILEELKQTGVPFYTWNHLRALLVKKLKESLDKMHQSDKYMSASGETFEERRNTIAEVLTTFEG